MRPFSILILTVVGLCGCTSTPKNTAAYDPATFRAEITRLIEAKNYRAAVALVKAADVDRQLAADKTGYTAIGGYAIYLPGIDSKIMFDRSRDWYVPGTSDAIENWEWQKTATEFAQRYNLRRRGMSG